MAQQLQARKRNRAVQELPARLEIVDVEKRRGISKYYVYVIKVTCRDGSRYIIGRRYRQFDELQRLLEQRFPVEAGEFHQRERILPRLPGKLYLSRSAVREVTDKRLPLLNNYLKQLLSLPDNIRYDSIVTSFVRQAPQDREAYPPDSLGSTGQVTKPARPSPPQKKSSAPPPRPAPPTSKPAPPTKPPPPTLVRGPRAKARYQYTGQYGDELSFPASAVIALERQVDSNWLLGRLGAHSGLVPVSYLSIVEPLPREGGLDDTAEQSDEWESGGEEDQHDSAPYITCCVVGGGASSVAVSHDLIMKPTLFRVRNAIQDHLGRRNFVLNYQDSDGDLIEIVDQSDLDLMTASCKKKPTSWTFYISEPGDHTPYNTHPYR